ncbi:MAG: argininosuccinate lyase, partial [Bacteroidales bacterium]|nr:argininosuccinate lyase [Bacteroidales bacterium]
GYHRDFQLLNAILFPALEMISDCLEMAAYMLDNVQINEHILDNPKYKYLFTVEEVNRRTLAGIPFREAYRQVGVEVNEGRFQTGIAGRGVEGLCTSDLKHTHAGSIGNLCNDRIRSLFTQACDW